MAEDDRDMTAHIPEGTAEDAERDMSAKTEQGEGIHSSSITTGIMEPTPEQKKRAKKSTKKSD
jgi:hypothetical protein